MTDVTGEIERGTTRSSKIKHSVCYKVYMVSVAHNPKY